MVAKRSRYTPRNNWNASWIWSDGDENPRNSHLYARKSFTIPENPVRARIRISADSSYKLYVNGSYVGKGPVRSHPRRKSFDVYDITELISKGNNLIAVHVHHLGVVIPSYVSGRPGLIAEADIEWDGGELEILTDDTWKASPSPGWLSSGAQMSDNLGFQEVYDFTLGVNDWNELKFKDAKWPTAVVLGRADMQPFERLSSRHVPYLQEEAVYPSSVVSIFKSEELPVDIQPADIPDFMATEELTEAESRLVTKPERLIEPKDSDTTVKMPDSGGVSIVLDFGREVYGCFEIATSKSDGGIIDIGYSETLEDGRVKPNRRGILYSDRLILHKGRKAWQSFESRAFRYVQLDFHNCPKPVGISRVLVREHTYPVELKGSFESNDELLNQIWRAGVETVRLSMQEVLIDDPWNSNSQRWDSTAIAGKVAYYAFGDVDLLTQAVRQGADTQRKEGSVQGAYPVAKSESSPDLGALWVMSVWDLYTFLEDRHLLAKLYPSVTRWLKWIEKHVDEEGLLCQVPGQLMLDYCDIDCSGEITALNCLYIGALRSACRIADALHLERDSNEWASRAREIRNALERHFWSPKAGLYSDARTNGELQEGFSQETNILTALYRVPDHYQQRLIFRQLLEGGDLTKSVTPYFASLLTEALSKSAHSQYALDLIRDLWGGMIKEGATSLWESFSGADGRCHSASAGVSYQLQSHFLGISPTGVPGRVRIEPHVADLQWAKGSVTTRNGKVSLEWNVSRRGFSMDVNIPEGMSAETYVPAMRHPSRVVVDGKDHQGKEIDLGAGKHRVQVLIGPSRKRSLPQESDTDPERRSLPVPTDRADIETVEQMIRILTDLSREMPVILEEDGSSAGESASKEKRKRSGRRSKRNKEHSTQPAADQQVETPAAPEAETTEAADRGKSHRRRHSKPVPVAEASDATAQPEDPASEVTLETKTEAESAPAKKPSRSGRRSGKKNGRQEETESSPAPEMETSDNAPASQPEPADVKKTPARRRRTRKQSEAPEKPQQEAVVSEQRPVAVEESQKQEESETKPKSSKRSPRRKPIDADPPTEKPAAADADASDSSPEPTLDNDNGKKRTRAYRRPRRTAKNDVETKATANSSGDEPKPTDS